MLCNTMKNYKIFTGVIHNQLFWLIGLTMLTLAFTAFGASAEQNFDASAEQKENSKLLGISYNTIQDDQIELVFEFSNEVLTLPEVQTSMNPAYVEISFASEVYGDKIKETDVNHAGVTNIVLDNTSGKVVALISLEKLSVFDVALRGNKFSITFNYGQSAEIVETLSPAGEQFINHVKSVDFRLDENNDAQVLVYLKERMVAVDINNKLGKVNVEFHNTDIIEDLLYKLDVTDFGTIVT
nr:type IV pilus secretin PilQ [Colwellia sp.]